MRCYSRTLKPRPFSQLLNCLQLLGWSVVDPPWIRDHEGRTWNLLTVSIKMLSLTLRDAWLQYVASVTSRNTMDGLVALDGTLTCLDYAKLSGQDRARLSALQCGAFISSAEHSHYDTEKSENCSLCLCADDRAHWLVCPRFAGYREAISNWDANNAALPACVARQLLIPRLHEAVLWRSHLWQIKDETDFCLFKRPPTMNQLFVDGSCVSHSFGELNFAAWALVSATTGAILVSSHLSGIVQTIDRAELTALVCATQWTAHHQVDACVWSDSLSTVSMAQRIQTSRQVPLSVENYDLWLAFLDALDLCESLTF